MVSLGCIMTARQLLTEKTLRWRPQYVQRTSIRLQGDHALLCSYHLNVGDRPSRWRRVEDAQTPQSNGGLRHERLDKSLDQAEETASVDGVDRPQ
jgi:hypothetical protein